MAPRTEQRRKWLANLFDDHQVDIEIASGDASFRSYYRVRSAAAPRGLATPRSSYILMDAPPERENIRAFSTITQYLAEAGLNAPEIFATDFAQGFLLLSDLGTQDYLRRLDAQHADQLYADALQALVQMQSGIDPIPLPRYDGPVLNTEMQLFTDWFLCRHLQLEVDADLSTILHDSFAFLTRACLEQPQVFVHRDYHSRNLMYCPGHNPGILDYQDALHGPIGYDLVSLLRDVYIHWPEQRVQTWMDQYFDLARTAGLLAAQDRQQLQRWFDLAGVQRHLKVAGIFARLYYRDHKSRYLADLPLTLEYLQNVARRYPQLGDLCSALEKLDIITANHEATARSGENPSVPPS